jgi:hypothetical protein
MGKISVIKLAKGRKAKVNRQVLNLHPEDELYCALCGTHFTWTTVKHHFLYSCEKWDNEAKEPIEAADLDDAEAMIVELQQKLEMSLQRVMRRDGSIAILREEAEGQQQLMEAAFDSKSVIWLGWSIW